ELKTVIQAPIEMCFDLARSVDLHSESVAYTQERAVAGRTTGLLELGDEVTWEAKHFGMRHRLTSHIVEFYRPQRFVVAMISGPFASHSHDFDFMTARDGQTVMSEVFRFRSPWGIAGRIVDALFMTRHLKQLMRVRNEYLKQRAEQMETTREAVSQE
ncbi:MAG: SRPBCC family protein, partial [Candidatus Dormibacteraceae bacterium]